MREQGVPFRGAPAFGGERLAKTVTLQVPTVTSTDDLPGVGITHRISCIDEPTECDGQMTIH